jgi:hypothetical protein
MACTPGSLLWHDVRDALGPGTAVAAGQLLLVFGGYNTMGEEFGADSTYVRRPSVPQVLLSVPAMHSGPLGGMHAPECSAAAAVVVTCPQCLLRDEETV